MFLFVGKIIAERAQLAQRSPIILQNSSNPSNWKNLDIRPYDRTTVRPYDRPHKVLPLPQALS